MAIEKRYGKNARAAFNANKNLQNSYRAAERMNDLNRTTMRPNMNIDDYMKNNSVSLENSRLIKPIIDTSNISVDNSTRPIGAMRETIKPIMDIDEYFKLERRDSFNFDRFKKDFGDTPIRDIENMFVNGTGDFKDFYNRNLYTPLSEASNIYSNTFDIASKYSTQRKEYEISQPNYDMEVGEYINRVDSPKDNFSYNNIYDSTDDIDNYYGMYGNVSSEIGVTPKPYEYQGKIKDLSINGTQSQNSDVKIDEGYDYTNIIDDDIDNYHSMYGQISDELDVSGVGNGVVKGKYEDQMNRIQNDYYDSVRINGDDLNKNGYQMQDVESSNFTLNSDFSSENVKLNESVVDDNITGYGSESYIDNWKNNNKNSLFSDYLKSNSSDIYDLSKELNIDNLINRVESGEQLKQFELDDIDYAKKELSGMYNRSLERAKELGIDNIDDFDEIKRINDITESLNGNKKRNTEQTINSDINTTVDSNATTVDTDLDNVNNNATEKTTENTNKTIDPKQEKISRMLDDDSYFQYNKNDDFYKDVNVLNKEKDPFDDIEIEDDEPDDFQTKPKETKETKDPFDDIEIEDDEPDDFQDDGPNDFKNDEPDDFQDDGPNDFKNDEPDDFQKKFNKARENGASEIEVEYDENNNPKLKSAKYKTENIKNSVKTFDYNTQTKDTVNAKEYAKQIYGEDVTDAQVKQLVEGYAESDSGIKKQMYEEGFDFGKVNMKTTGDSAESVGRVIADLKGDGVINDSGVFDPEAAIKAVDGINGPFNKESVLKGFKSQAYRNRFNKEYKDYQNDLFRMSEDLNNSKKDVKDIIKKMENEGTLTPKEAKAFHKHQVKLKTYHDNVIKWAEDRGFDPESVFGERFKGKGKDKYKGTRDWMFNTESINNINNELDLLDTRVNLETGEYTTKKTEARDAMKKDLTSLLDNNGYKTAYNNSKIKDNYLDYLSKNKEALTNDTAKKLYNLQQKDGVDIGDEGRQVLQGLAIAHEGKLDEKNGAVTKLNTALETLSSENYMNIKDDNIDRIGKGLVYKDNKYQLDMDKLNLTDEQKNSETFKKIIESDNVGTEDLKGIFDASTVNNYIQGKNIDEKEFNKIIGEKVSGLEDSKYDTGLNIKEQLKKRGIEDNKIIDEIANTKNNGTDNLSAEAKVAIATMKDPLDQNEIDFGSISKDKMKEYINNNKGFFGDPKDIENMNEKELYGLFGKAFEGTVTDGKLAKGYDFKVKGKDVTTAEGFTDFYNSVLGEDGKDLDWDKVFNSLGATEEGKAQFKDAFEWMKGKKGQKEFKQMNIANSARDYLVKMFDEASGNENIDAKTKEQIKKHAEILKTKKMDDVASKVDVDSITKDIGKFDKIGKEAGKGIVDSIKGGGKWKTIGGAALALGGLGALGMFASNAAEERERKRQEMQQLMMAQNQSIRGGY